MKNLLFCSAWSVGTESLSVSYLGQTTSCLNIFAFKRSTTCWSACDITDAMVAMATCSPPVFGFKGSNLRLNGICVEEWLGRMEVGRPASAWWPAEGGGRPGRDFLQEHACVCLRRSRGVCCAEERTQSGTAESPRWSCAEVCCSLELQVCLQILLLLLQLQLFALFLLRLQMFVWSERCSVSSFKVHQICRSHFDFYGWWSGDWTSRTGSVKDLEGLQDSSFRFCQMNVLTGNSCCSVPVLFCKQKWWSLASAGLQLWFHYSEAERWFSPKPAQIFTTLVKLLPETDVSLSGFRIQFRFLHWNMLLKVGTSLHTCLYLLNESLQNKQIFDYYGLLATELVLQKNPASLKDLQQMTS